MAGWKQNVIFDIVPVAAALFIVLTVRCTMDLAGGSSEIGNGIVLGRVVDGQGNPACSTIVRIMPSDYNPLKNGPLTDTCIDTTNAEGMYRFVARHGQTFSIQAVQMALRTRVLVPGVEMKNADLTVPQCTLKVPGAIIVSLPDSIDPLFGYVYVPGSDIFAFLNNSAGFVTLDSVPAGIIPAVSYSSTAISASSVIRYDVPVIPFDTTVVWNPSWKYARRLFLNTTASGANVSGNVYNFPVLVRLTAGNFTFAQAKADGGDLRFTKNDSTLLPYEVERWDAANQRAEIWVKADTVYGNDNSHFITIYWGNQAAADSSNGASVFDTADGFAGVWHLGENGDSIYDATGNAFNGGKYGSTGAPGIIGNSESFANGNYIRISGLLNRPSDVTLSAWVRSDTSAGRGQDIVSIGDAVLIRFDDVSGVGTAGFYHNNPVVNDSMYGRVSSGRYLAKTGWHYLAFSINSASHVQTLYIDGVECANTQDVNPIYYAGLGTDTYIGIHGNGKTAFNFIGQIDEVRVNNRSVAPDWINLCFMNQKAQDALIVW